MAGSTDTLQKIKQIRRDDPRFRLEAYLFTLEALNHTLEDLRRHGHEGHIDGPQLLYGIRDYARRLFGYLGAAVFREWGITSTADFGTIVFHLVDAQLLSTQESDSPADFEDVYDLQAAFEEELFHS